MKFFDDSTIRKIREGFYSAVYFNRTQHILLEEKNFSPITMQVFQKNDGVMICGIDEVVELFQNDAGYLDNGKWIDMSKKIEILGLHDGDIASSRETIMHISGPYVCFAHLESLYLGILARRTRVAARTQCVVEAAAGKQVVFFADRFDYFLNQPGDGYAAHLAGISGVSTPAHAFLFEGKPMGTIPHALIALHNGDTVAAARQFAKHYPDIPLIVLADFQNDCVTTALEVARVMGKQLFGIRLDTSEDMVDKAFENDESRKGVNPELVKRVRAALDREGFKNVKIIVSGGFTKEKIELFEKEKTPVDIYGVGSYLLQGSNDFTADIVKVNEKEVAKVGRKYKENARMRKYEL